MNDDVATVEEVVDAIRFAAGLRWASTGTVLTYRIAGGESGMRHFMAQFGPALQWPWTKLTDVPELTDELADKVVAQSNAHARGLSLRELERLRDDCLVSVLQALRTHALAAGEVLNDYERRLFDARPQPAAPPALDEPLRLHETTVQPDWIDYNGHLTESRYLDLLATAEMMLLHVDAKSECAATARADIVDRARELAAAHAALPAPDRAGRRISLEPQ